MNRRNFLTLLGAAPVFAGASGMARGQGILLQPRDLAVSARATWESWKSGYLQPDGRVVDRLQSNASHSEGQGYGMVLATEFGDHEAFRRMLDWTEMNLAVRADGLLAWRYLPEAPDQVPDRNNASDGDLFFAWALLRASRKFSENDYLTRATRIATTLAEKCILPSPADTGELLFLPAVHGFVHEGSMVINPSYLMPLAMRELAAATGVSALAVAAQHGEALTMRLALDGLVPDWISVTRDGISAAEGFSPNAGYEAMRVPLFLVWSGHGSHPAVQQMMRVYERTVGPGLPVPTLIEPASGVVLEASDDPGYRALAGLISCAGRVGRVGADMPAFDHAQPYYPATLQMFVMIAANEVSPECVPV
ncbi:glycosyl hydrolase family 8 [Pararhodobacter sp.]|uniref:glycosyl hydrolase family 8 n=1 Tax=Pararhodobacter sp. TaxID=2127056 RepID=UPI002FDEED14